VPEEVDSTQHNSGNWIGKIKVASAEAIVETEFTERGHHQIGVRECSTAQVNYSNW
jgi:hypothetical protein